MRLKILLSFISILFLANCTEMLPKQDACGFVQNSLSQRVSWTQKSLPITFYIHSSFQQHPQAKEIRQSLESAMKHWNKYFYYEVFRLSPVYTEDKNSLPQNDHKNIIYLIKDWPIEKKYVEQARTTVYWSEDRIYEADMMVNEYFKLYTGSEERVPSDQLDFQSLMIHELGHVLGLGHYEDKGAVMKAKLANGEERRSLGLVDLQALECEYEIKNRVL